MEKIQKTSLQLCMSCFKMLSPHFGCLECSGNRFYSSITSSFANSSHRYARSMQPNLSSMSSGIQLQRQSLILMGRKEQIINQKGLSPQLCVRSFASGPEGPKLPPRKSKLDSGKSPISWKNLLIFASLGGAVLFGMQYVKKEKEQKREKSRQRYIGKAKLGGDWTLTDHHGKKRSSTDFRGQWILIYFGFTNCPDICPEEIEKIVNVINKADADKDLPTIQPIVITVDPERDTPEALKEYCGEFSPRLLGFTGTQEEIYQATRAFRVYYSQGPKDEDNDYIVDHSIISYLMNPKGEFVDYFGQNKTADQIYTSMKFHILSYQKNQN